MVDYLFENKPKYLLIDEIDKMPSKDQTFLLNLMETGIVTETKHRKTRTAQMKITYTQGIDHPLKNSQDKTSLNKKQPASVSKQLSTTIRPKTTFNMTSNNASNLNSNSLGQNPDFGLTTS